MTYEEAKNNLKGNDGMIMPPSDERDEALRLAVEALEKMESIAELEKQVKQLQNRCYLFSQGATCIYCGFSDCEHRYPAKPKKIRKRDRLE